MGKGCVRGWGLEVDWFDDDAVGDLVSKLYNYCCLRASCVI